MKTHLLYFFTIIFSFTLSAQTTYYVKAGGVNTNTGLDEQNALSTVSQAISNSSDGDIITIVGAINQTGQVTISKSLSFVGQNNATITGVSGTVARMYVVTASSLTMSFSNITFTGSIDKDTANGAVFSITGDSDITISECTFDGNSTLTGFQGGAIFVENGTLNITNSLFKNNIAGRSGGAIYVNAGPGPIVNITRSTFYNNLAEGTGGSDGGGAIMAEGTTQLLDQITITNCTFFENKITKTSTDYGAAIRSTNANISVTNSLFYNNKITDGTGLSSDFGSAPGGVQSFTYSIGEWISSNVDTKSNFISAVKGVNTYTAADLTSSNLRFDATFGKVIYDNVAAGLDSPIDFGSDGNDAGSWDSGYTLSFEHLDIKDVVVFYQKQTKSLFVQHSDTSPIKMDIYNVLGAKVMSKNDVEDNESIDVSSLKSGVYFVLLQNKNNAITKKALIQ